ncbi:glycine-rich cell wall structural protein 1-like [Capsicum annuum]|uniref:glycine-rich cell wall structural protein 1-like n=1 Tax=Capsicum annuum TaxID=4072 RepID=UPI001FB084A2|nr:glycine-rich cell wall structural protein 1-like [Capsicum annuum]
MVLLDSISSGGGCLVSYFVGGVSGVGDSISSGGGCLVSYFIGGVSGVGGLFGGVCGLVGGVSGDIDGIGGVGGFGISVGVGGGGSFYGSCGGLGGGDYAGDVGIGRVGGSGYIGGLSVGVGRFFYQDAATVGIVPQLVEAEWTDESFASEIVEANMGFVRSKKGQVPSKE